MSAKSSSIHIAWVPACFAILLWIAATLWLTEESWRAGNISVQAALTPLITASAVAAAVMAHHRLMQWKLLAAAMFAVLTLLGSTLIVLGTIGRVATAHDSQTASRKGANENYKRKEGELAKAAVEANRECQTLGKRCLAWQSRVDTLTAEMAGLVIVSEDPKIDAAVNFANVVMGADAGYVRRLLNALEPCLLPLFLEIAAAVFGAAAFPHKKCLPPSKEPLTLPPLQPASDASVAKSFSVTDARRDLQQLKACNSQAFLASRWGVSESTVSRWLQAWQAEGTINRTRDGKSKATLALPPPPEPARRRLGHMT